MVKECRHIMPSGKRCHSCAMRDKSYCYFHQRLHTTINASKHVRPRLELASIEDPKGIQTAVTQVVEAFRKSRIDAREAATFLYGLQLATQLTKSPGPDPSNCVHDVFEEPDGSLIASDPCCTSPLACSDCPLTELCPEEKKQSKLICD
jgi:hypothetical protein